MYTPLYNQQDFLEPEASPDLTDQPATNDEVPANSAAPEPKVKPSLKRKQNIVSTPVVGEIPADTTLTADKSAKPDAKTKKKRETKKTEEVVEPLPVEAAPVVKPKTRSVRKKAEPLPQQTVMPEELQVTFKLRYTTKFGQGFHITGNHPLLGNWNLAEAFAMEYGDEEFWQASLTLLKSDPEANDFRYKYVLTDSDGTRTIEWGEDKTIQIPAPGTTNVMVIDSWNYAGFFENTFYTEPFTKVFFKNNYTKVTADEPSNYTHIFKVKAPLLKPNQALCLCGNVPELGGWSREELNFLSKTDNDDWWTIKVNLLHSNLPLAYKYGVYNLPDKTLAELEGGNNRVLHDTPSADKLTVVTDCFINLPNNTFRGAGIAIPVFSLRTENSFGVGEFNDLKLLVDWAVKTGLKVIQLLPVNDTTATHTQHDSYPYAAISAFALHPLYLHLPSILTKKDKNLLAFLKEKRDTVNSSAAVDYTEVTGSKFAFITKAFASQKKQVFKSEAFSSFFTANAHWLVPYAVFSYLRDQYKTVEYKSWPQHSTYDSTKINELAGTPAKAKDEISIYYFIQYHLHLQLTEATRYAHANGVIVKGDLPIGIYRNSCDAWQKPELYNMDMQAGAPPDDFAVKGQNWSFPTYNWHHMADDGFDWWKKRFAQMSYYFDAFRIDHILGFFRIWSIPMDSVEGIMGYFVPALPLSPHEFMEGENFPFLDRLTKPFINNQVLEQLFGNDKAYVTETYLRNKGDDTYELLPAFDTQRKVEHHFASSQANDADSKFKTGLFDLISNVILFEEKESNQTRFHFRISMENTASFKNLDQHVQNRLQQLYVDYFYRRQDQFWRQEGMAKLPEIKRGTNMLICGEDLGMVPSTVPGVMRDLGILSLEIQRMPKYANREFFHPNDAPYLSVVTPSTHDMSTIRAWWEEDSNVTQRFYNRELGQYGKAPEQCEAWINKTILLQHLYSPAMWSIFQLQDLLGMSEELRRSDPQEERINVPANPKHYWRYRMHLTLEKLLTEDEFNNQLKELVKASGR